MSVTLAESYQRCEAVARERARNFYYSFVLLPRHKRAAMCAIYAFMRQCDDLSDEPGAELKALADWRRQLDRALSGEYGEHFCWPALHDTVSRFGIPPRYLHEMIDGVSSDLQPRRIVAFDELYRYCYLVASVVGLTITHIFEFDSPQALPLAEKCGIAFQLTNIIRDVKEDAANGRVYLPEEDLVRFGVDAQAFVYDDAFRALLQFEADRAHTYYSESLPLIGMVNSDSRRALAALIAIYRRLLDRIVESNYDVLSHRVRLPAWEKSWLVARAFFTGDVPR